MQINIAKLLMETLKKENKYEFLPDPLLDRVESTVSPPPNLPMPTERLFQFGNSVPDWRELKGFFQMEGKLNKKDIFVIVKNFIATVKKEPNLIYIDDPVTIVGDIHGQYYDLLKVLEVGGKPEDTKYCFLGDIVDRGLFSTECIILLLSLKLNYPSTITLLRGNHESRQMTAFFNFRTECIIKYDEEVYDIFMSAFDVLPLAAIINNKFFAVHGGISPNCVDLKSINDINRFEETPKEGGFCDLLWSDPIEDENEALNLEWEENTNRGCSFNFGAKALLPYLNSTSLVCVIRAHEAQLDGFKMYKWNKKVDFPTCVTVFSAANYCDVYNNKGAVIKFKNNLFNLVQFNCSPHPFLLPDFHNLFSWSMPFISEKSNNFLFSLRNAS